MAIGVLGLMSGILDLIKTRELRPASAFALFGFIWLASMTIEIVIFTGWVTGLGDDHTTRVLIRYYEFLFLIIPLAGLAALRAGFGERVNFLVRWVMAAIFAALVTPAFTGFFGTLAIQIADAPTLAGLVVNEEIFNSAALLGFASILVFAAFPKWSVLVFIALLPVTMVGTGWQIQDQYQAFRGVESPEDIVGRWLSSRFTSEEISHTWILANTRFQATNVAFWADDPTMKYDMFGGGSLISPELAPQGTRFVVVVGDLDMVEGTPLIESGVGYKIYSLSEDTD